MTPQQGWYSPARQLASFRFYQDRETDKLLIFPTWHSERSAQKWTLVDYYRYRVGRPELCTRAIAKQRLEVTLPQSVTR